MSSGGWENGSTSRTVDRDIGFTGNLAGALTADGQPLVYFSHQNVVMKWDAWGSGTVRRFPRDGSILWVPTSMMLAGGRPAVVSQEVRAADGATPAESTPRLSDPDTGDHIGPALAAVPGTLFRLAPVTMTDGRVLLAGVIDGKTIRFWDTATGELTGPQLTGIARGIATLDALTVEDRVMLLFCGTRGLLTAWDMDVVLGGVNLTGVSVPQSSRPTSAALLPGPGGAFWAAVATPTNVRIFDLDTGRLVTELLAAESSFQVARLPIRGGGALLAVYQGTPPDGTDPDFVQLYDPASLQPVGSRLLGAKGVSLTSVPLPGGRFALASGGPLAPVIVWEPAASDPEAKVLGRLDAPVLALVVTVTREGRVVLASGGSDKTVRLWDVAAGTPIGAPLTGHTGPVLAAAAVPAAPGATQTVIVTGGDTTVRRWDAAAGTAIGQPLSGHTGTVRAVSAVALPGGPVLILSTGNDGTLRRWDADTGDLKGQSVTDHAGAVLAITSLTTSDGKVLAATGGDDSTIRLWDPATGLTVGAPLTGHAGAVGALTPVTVQGQTLLASGSNDATVRLWDPATGQPVGSPLTGHAGAVRAVAALPRPPGPALLVSASDDGTARLWNPATGALAAPPLTQHTGPVRATTALLAGSADLATAGDDGTILLWTIG